MSSGRELSSEWSHHRISSTYSKNRVTLQNSIKHSGSERVNPKLFHQVHYGSFQGHAIKSSHHANFYLNVCNNRDATSLVFNISFLLTTKSSNTQQSMEWHNNYEQYWIRCTGTSVSSQVIYMKYAILKSSLAHDKKKATLWDCSTMLI